MVHGRSHPERPRVTSQGHGVYTRVAHLYNHVQTTFATSWSILRLHAISSKTVRSHLWKHIRPSRHTYHAAATTSSSAVRLVLTPFQMEKSQMLLRLTRRVCLARHEVQGWDEIERHLEHHSNSPDALRELWEAPPEMWQNIIWVFLENLIGLVRRQYVTCINVSVESVNTGNYKRPIRTFASECYLIKSMCTFPDRRVAIWACTGVLFLLVFGWLWDGFCGFWLSVCFLWWLGLVWLLGGLGDGCLFFYGCFPWCFLCWGGGLLIICRITSISAAIFLSVSWSSVKMSSVGTWCLVCLVFSHFARMCSCVSSSFPHSLHWRSWYLFL